MRQNFLSVPVYGGCAALSNEGDFVRIAAPLGAELRNMQYAWMCPIPLEKAVRRDPDLSGMFSVAGDSMIFVNKHGRRVVNEKLPYNELAQVFFTWDGDTAEYPNLVLVQIWDQRSQDHSASDEYGRLIVPPGSDDRHVIRGDTLAELTRNINDRLANYATITGGFRLADDFLPNLEASITRFNELASSGKDTDFGRGERAISMVFNGDVREELGRANPTMWPISDTGPYYAALVTGGTLDTKGGPKVSPDGQVLDDTGTPIPGLYGVGNCVASPSAQAYWAGGATLGPIIAMAYRAASAAHHESVETDGGPHLGVMRTPCSVRDSRRSRRGALCEHPRGQFGCSAGRRFAGVCTAEARHPPNSALQWRSTRDDVRDGRQPRELDRRARRSTKGRTCCPG